MTTTVGYGPYTYTMDTEWAKVPAHIKLGYCHGIVTDAADNVYLFHTKGPSEGMTGPSVVKFDAHGNYLAAWGDEFGGGGAHGMLLHVEDGREVLYLTDINRGLVVKTTLDGEVLLELGVPDRPDLYDAERKYRPTDVAVAPGGDFYVADGYGQNYVHRYKADGTYVSSFGGKGSGVGELSCPHGVSIDTRRGEPEVYVADRSNNRIQVFTLEGEHKRFIDENMDWPCSFFFHEGDMYVPDLHSRVTIFDSNDRLITHLGEDQQLYKREGWPNLPADAFRANRFSSPHGLCVDPGGNIYVAEWTVNGRVTKLTKQG
ncbi:hypothetical protein IDH44_03285 [Paenibacillus sp. IB182496]|uniref:NHL repeat-containing protein n=1 Tax=Paenibacillus sabuli TaxID=2772509 RepID=A0A927GQS5_9BACL|nr:hypothetical protein [Paenibacillus sabuli]MBD2844200.1 hypothetical protein [Paenibacillus sabuli]